MQQFSYEYPPSGGARKKIPLDIGRSRPNGPQSAVSPRKIYYPSLQGAQDLSTKRSLDGIRKDRKPFLKTLHQENVSDVLFRLFRKTQLYVRRSKRIAARLMPDLAPKKMLYGSLVGGVAFGMVSMAFIEHVFGPGVFARSSEQTSNEIVDQGGPLEGNEALAPYSGNDNDIFFEYFSEAADDEYQKNVREMVKGYPIEEMLPYIFEQDRVVAAFLIGIGKKESNWGKRVPVLDGQDCFNYWGYRGQRRMMGSGGHTCFNSRKDAVETVAKRLDKLINSEKLNTPEKLVVWKCGFSCEGHSRESVKKWISDVDMYYEELKDE